MSSKGFGQPINLTMAEIKYACTCTMSCTQAAQFLHVSYDTFKKYAEQYIDDETGLSLFELQKDKYRSLMNLRKQKRGWNPDISNIHIPLNEVLKGMHPTYHYRELRQRLINNPDFLPLECDVCGMDEKRELDGIPPFKLVHNDGDRTNHVLDNLRWVCFNCYHLTEGNVAGRQPSKNAIYHKGNQNKYWRKGSKNEAVRNSINKK